MDPLPPHLSTDLANSSFKLFGKIIPSEPLIIKDAEVHDLIDESFSPRGVEELGMSSGSSSLSNEADAPKEGSQHRPAMAVRDLKEEESQEDGTSKTLPRPKNLVPCPRCNSSDTKFCYFNNYNVNQPRHFCKSCQRYWTAGGMLRNVPVGAGRRKNKHGASLQKQPFLDNVVMNRVDCGGAQPLLHIPISSRQENPPLTPEVGCQLVIDLEKNAKADFSEAKNPTEATMQIKQENGSARLEPISNSNCADFGASTNSCAFPFYGLPWPYAYMTMAHAAAAPGNPNLGAVNFPVWNGPPALPGGVWNPQTWPVPWNVQWPSCTAAPTPPSSGAGSDEERALKRSRSPSDSSLCIPKTLRIHDPEVAARSSIFSTLGFNNEQKTLPSTGIFSAFQPKAEVFQPQPGSKMYEDHRHANPAASSRSLAFQESE